MSLTEKISADLIAAMKGGDKVALEAIRAAKTAFLLAKSEKGQEALTSDEELKVIQKLVKQRRESAEIYVQNNRPELATKEKAEADILAKYLPEKISPGELEKILKEIIAKTGAKSPADMGKVMGMASKELAGRAEGREISAKVKELLSQ
ncbi:MAG TPA: GatB/YqeY domain-containing protein [Bacteroidales bacterium]|nr:GatB/YqeY domain-containing protein [Bacteroidales bacterium]